MMGEHPSDARLLLALDGELEAREAALVADHVRACPACHATWERLSTLSGDIERYCRTSYVEQWVAASTSASAHAPASQRRIRETAQDAAQWQRSWRPRVFSQSAALATAAALLLIGAGGWLLWPRDGAGSRTARGLAPARPETILATRETDIALASAAPASAHDAAHAARAAAARASDIAGAELAARPIAQRAAAAGPRAEPTRPGRATAVRAAAARAQAAPQPARRAPTYYWTLPYSNGALPLTEGSVVMTVRLSRDQLRLAGIPVTEPHFTADRNRDQSLVRAKVLVGADGLPRAIAFDQD